MGIIETKYSVGDTIYSFGSEYAQKAIQCPDCLGTKEWTITFADGHSEKCACYTCHRICEGSLGVIYYNEWQPTVEKHTIKEVRFGSEGAEYYVDYWFKDREGHLHLSNRIFHDTNIFDNEEQARLGAQAEYEKQMARIADNNFPKKGDFAKALENSHYGYRRHETIIKTKEMEQWLNLMRPLQPRKKGLRQFEGQYSGHKNEAKKADARKAKEMADAFKPFASM